jgi:iron complex outermembrane recepter protein
MLSEHVSERRGVHKAFRNITPTFGERYQVYTTRSRALLFATTSCVSALLYGSPAPAQQQDTQATGELQEIIVTARKREESILNVPVVETVVPAVQLERLQTQDLKDLATLVPGLVLGDSVLAIGTQVSLRGVGSTSFDAGLDQSVSLNVDGLSLSQGLAYSSGLFDLGQAEVLEGPQALFHGKSNTGGVISLRTVDPTDKFQFIASTGYEFDANEKQGSIIVSGPVTNTLKMRLAGQYDAQNGYFENLAAQTGVQPGTGAATPTETHVTPDENYDIRGTVLWNPVDQLDGRLKINQVHDRALYGGAEELAQCTSGTGPVFGL